ncbi:Leucine-rich repeat transmembrane protein FLRT2 [Xyrichtys novacula]|uniref:Leucine-rich repeat transmembrane protein FLRT2 n=1 Tax=Xyrichtys novacula TaxID=13765 RepID=A0AAV1GYY0_XYRNO|nr:Leucine-rich repeat transmembrane protein FLRT2 [Xyrichtys novacula]
MARGGSGGGHFGECVLTVLAECGEGKEGSAITLLLPPPLFSVLMRSRRLI